MVSLIPRSNHPWGEGHQTSEDSIHWYPLWADSEGNEYWCECEIRDRHLVNIISFLKRSTDPNVEDDTLGTMIEIAEARGLRY